MNKQFWSDVWTVMRKEWMEWLATPGFWLQPVVVVITFGIFAPLIAGRLWLDIGTGAWDRERRPSEARVNRIIRIAAADVRRVGAMLNEDIFAQVTAEVLRHY